MTDRSPTARDDAPLDPLRLAKLYREHRQFVVRILRRFGVVGGELDDATQEVFLVLHRQSQREPILSVRGFLTRVAWRVAIGYSRRAHGLPRPGGDHAHPPAPDDLEERIGAAEILRRVESHLGGPKSDRWAILVLADVEGLTAEEIGIVFGLPVGTVYSRLHRMRRKLRRIARNEKWFGALIPPWLPALGQRPVSPLLATAAFASNRALGALCVGAFILLVRLQTAMSPSSAPSPSAAATTPPPSPHAELLAHPAPPRTRPRATTNLLPDAGLRVVSAVDDSPVPDAEVTLHDASLGHTDANGVLAPTDVSDPEGVLLVRAEGFAPLREPYLSRHPQLLRLLPESTIAGIVLDCETRRPIANAIVLDGTGAETTSDGEGRFELAGLAAGAHMLIARGDRFRGTTGDFVGVGIGDRTAGVEILVDRAYTLRVQMGDLPSDDMRLVLMAGGEQRRVAPDPHARFEVFGLLPGEYTLGLRSRGVSVDGLAEVEVIDQDVYLELPAPPTHAVDVVVRDQDAEPVGGLLVNARSHLEAPISIRMVGGRMQRSAGTEGACRTGPEGRCTLHLLGDANFGVEASGVTGAPDIVIPRDDGTVLELVAATQRGTLEGLVRDANGTLATGILLVVRGQMTAESRLERTDVAGRFESTGLPLDTYDVIVYADRTGPGASHVMISPGDAPLTEASVKLDQPGHTAALDIRLEEPLGSIAGLLHANGHPVAGATILATIDNGGTADPRLAGNPPQPTDAHGRFRIDGLLPGTSYTIAAFSPDGRRAASDDVFARDLAISLEIE